MAGGRRIAVPQGRSGRGTRPTTDRVRESLFNVLAVQLDFDGLAVLDLFAGSGALGLEALSRGAATALFVESDARAAAVIAANVKDLGVRGAVVRRGRVEAVLGAGAPGAVDLVFADPPYELPNGDVEAMLSLLATHGWAAAGTTVVVERSASGAPLNWPPGWRVHSVRKYGDTRLEFGELHDGG